jgi:hypothetical protein
MTVDNVNNKEGVRTILFHIYFHYPMFSSFRVSPILSIFSDTQNTPSFASYYNHLKRLKVKQKI